MRILLWRCCHDSLPCTVNLRRRRLRVNPLFPCCGEENEDIIRALFACDHVAAIWMVADWWLVVSLALHSNILEVFGRLQLVLGEKVSLLVGWFLGLFGGQRNAFVYNGVVKNPTSVLAFARMLLDEFCLIQDQITAAYFPRVRINPKWQPPPMDMFKMNIDIVFGAETTAISGALVSDVITLFNQLGFISCSFIPGEGNRVPHYLAKCRYLIVRQTVDVLWY
ncbi:hypothetical protein ACOSP7_010155 [Xanthoceras sorbifolium]